MRARNFLHAAFALYPLLALSAVAEEPKPSPENTISIKLENEVRPQTFPRQIKFLLEKVIDRSANPQPMLVLKERGGVFLDKEPTEIVQQALTETLQKSNLMAPDRASADYLLIVYLFHFGLASGSGVEYYGKVDLNVVVKNVSSGKSTEITALGTSIQGGAVRKKNILKNVQANIDEALESALRNFLRGTKLHDAVAAPEGAAAASPQARINQILLNFRLQRWLSLLWEASHA